MCKIQDTTENDSVAMNFSLDKVDNLLKEKAESNFQRDLVGKRRAVN